MKELSKLMGYREEIRVLDATMRDGGIVNDFMFSDDFVRALYQTNLKAGIDYMEVGYRASKEMFDESKYGKWKFSTDEDIRAVIGDNEGTELKLAIMTDVGRTDYKKDIHPRAESPVDLVRVACYVHQIPQAIDMIIDAKNKGYEVSANIMAISNAQESDIKIALEMIGQSPVDVIYIVDSFGSLFPEQIARIADLYCSFAEKYNKQVGMHAHNNQQLAFANTIEAVGDGVNFLDATYNGMGRGAGNCYMEHMLGFLHNPKYKIYPAIQFIEKYMPEVRAAGARWGYDLQYYFTGLLNQHPRSAIAFTADGRTDYASYYKELISLD